MASNNNLTDVFNDIATAINNKGVSGTMMPTEMADKIAEIPSGSSGSEFTKISFADCVSAEVEL